MLTATRALEEVHDYRRRVGELYEAVRSWVIAGYPNAVFSQTPVELAEEAAGTYQVQSLDLALPGLPAVRFVPRGIFWVGARGCVDVRSRLGRETLVWIEAGGPAPRGAADPDDEPETVITRPLFQNVAEGWAWSDSKSDQVLPLDHAVFEERVLRPLTH